jgi:DNA-binding CsgD family transcriptional regulator
VVPGFAVDAGNRVAVAGICRRLDGIPLAIELAAVRLRSLSPGQIRSRLDSRFALLSGGGPADQPHHRTLRAALEWSYELLTEAEQAMWRRLSVFAGSFDLDAAQAACGVGRVVPGQVADLVDALVAKSILLRCDGQGKVRYRLLETIAEFGLAKLRGRGNERRLRLRHRAWYAGLAVQQEAWGPGRAAWIAALDADHENLRAALEFSLSEPQEVAAGAELACDLWRYWETHGHLTEGRRILAAVVEKLDTTAEVRPRVLWVAGYLAIVQADLPAARTLLEAGLSAADSAGDVTAMAFASTLLGLVLSYLGESGQGRALAERSLMLHRQSADQTGMVLALAQLGFIHLGSGELEVAAIRYGECGRLAARCGNLWYQRYAWWGLGGVAYLRGDHDHASEQVCAALRAGRGMDDALGTALCLDVLAWAAASRMNAAQSAALLAAADAAWAVIPAVLPPVLRVHHDAALASCREIMAGSAYKAAHAKGSAMSQADAIAFALGETVQPVQRQAGADQLALTRREQDVAELVAQGLSNGQIAGALVISVRTVESHVQHIMDKLGVSARTQIAAWAATQRPAH